MEKLFREKIVYELTKVYDSEGDYTTLHAVNKADASDSNWIGSYPSYATPAEINEEIKRAQERIVGMNSAYFVHINMNKDFVKLFEDFDVTPIEVELSAMLGMAVELKKEVVASRNGAINRRYELESVDFLDMSTNAALKTIFKNFRVYSFTSYNAINQTNGMLSIVLDISVRYQHHGGGSNGTSIAILTINEDGTYDFVKESERYNN